MTERSALQNPWLRAWRRFKGNRLGYRSLQLFLALTLLSLFAEVLSNDKPLLVRYNGHWYVPQVQRLPETTFGGEFLSPTDFLDPFIRKQLARPGNFALFPPNRYHHSTINYFSREPNPAPPSGQNWIGTDDRGRDLLARLLYGFRLSVLFAFAVTIVCTLAGVVYGAIQGYFAGWTDIAMERFVEIWGAMPTLYLLIIFSAFFAPSVGLLVALISIFGWLMIAAYVRAARALGQRNRVIIFKHILPNCLTPVITLIPFEMAGAIGALTSLDFLGLGVPEGTPSLGELLAQGKNNLDAWWISLATFTVLVFTLVLLILVGDALRDALDPRKEIAGEAP